MELKTLLSRKRKAIIDRWLTLVANTYPPDTADFLRRERNRFNNPVGYTLASEFETLFDALIDNADTDAVRNSLENINKIRAVQDFSPSHAVAFIFFLKTAVRDELAGHLADNRFVEQLLALESSIDGMALLAFDSFMQCREKLFDVKCREIKRRAALFNKPGRKTSTR